MVEKEAMIYQLLAELNIEYVRLDHEPIYSVRDTEIRLPGQQVKNLLLKTKKGRQFYLFILPDEKTANIKQLAEALGEKRLSFASDSDLEDLLQVEAGSVTPFGLIFDTDKKVQVLVDETVDDSLTVGFHPFVNTTTLNISYHDFLRFVDFSGHEAKRILG
ncbi:prolyl-tRNA synthetase associated domain-containing protein [Streptococcus himalayensis]|uniref:Prolyl-tRNA editing protein n=1 Tax=Streptococcus himalayensis TaxID=1888195 RepID=A0A917A3A7_9STRE|nr:prolyl-tRNA synthetase associated domain-containing protein [Streptococcus himalayensis]GGE24421.1 prolyl-tRNA editing protein [Streptococcus himalayensis]